MESGSVSPRILNVGTGCTRLLPCAYSPDTNDIRDYAGYVGFRAGLDTVAK